MADHARSRRRLRGTNRSPLTFALRHDQKAYFDLKRGVSVEVNTKATSGGAANGKPTLHLTSLAEKTPEEPANVDAGAATASPAAPCDATAPDAGNKGGNGSGGSDVVHLPVPSGNSAATPDTPRLRLFDRISNLNKI